VALDAAMPAPVKPAYPKSLNSDGKQQRWLALAGQRREADLPALLALLHDGSSRDVEERAIALREWVTTRGSSPPSSGSTSSRRM
jgi:hypothetical protein